MLKLCKHVVAVNIYHDINVTLYIVASIHSIQTRTRNSQKLGNKLENDKAKIQERKLS